MDAALNEMVLTAYDETYHEALDRGFSAAEAHAEGITAASMCLAAMTGIEDAAARAKVISMSLEKQLAA